MNYFGITATSEDCRVVFTRNPFREGNGRLARLIANIMALQAGYPELDFFVLDKYKDKYFKAIQSGLNCNYEPLKWLFRQVLQNSEKAFSSKFKILLI